MEPLSTGQPQRPAWDNFQFLHTLLRAVDLLDPDTRVIRIVAETHEDFEVYSRDDDGTERVEYVQVKTRQNTQSVWTLGDLQFREFVERSAQRFAVDSSATFTFATNRDFH